MNCEFSGELIQPRDYPYRFLADRCPPAVPRHVPDMIGMAGPATDDPMPVARIFEKSRPSQYRAGGFGGIPTGARQ
jgi:hypothetical protein